MEAEETFPGSIIESWLVLESSLWKIYFGSERKCHLLHKR
jgi:hypothetical protein